MGNAIVVTIEEHPEALPESGVTAYLHIDGSTPVVGIRDGKVSPEIVGETALALLRGVEPEKINTTGKLDFEPAEHHTYHVHGAVESSGQVGEDTHQVCDCGATRTVYVNGDVSEWKEATT